MIVSQAIEFDNSRGWKGWKMEDGRMEDGRWKDGRWKMEDGRL